MASSLEYSFSSILNDPTNKLHGTNLGPRDWNEFQKSAKLKPLELKYPYNRKHLVRLANVKTGIYNPVLPTLRKIDREDTLCKLSDEHARHTSFIEEEYFKDFSFNSNVPLTRSSINWEPSPRLERSATLDSIIWKTNRESDLSKFELNTRRSNQYYTDDLYDDDIDEKRFDRIRGEFSTYRGKVLDNI